MSAGNGTSSPGDSARTNRSAPETAESSDLSTPTSQPSTRPPPAGGRVIAIGDIHGCADEFEALLVKLAPTSADRIILLGDLINRGPDSRRVITLARAHAHVSLLGNHELRLLNYRSTGDTAHLKKSDFATLDQLGETEWAYLKAMPLTYRCDEHATVMVHGGFVPGRAWDRQPARVVTRVQVVDEHGEPRKRADCPGAPHWSELWSGPPFVIYGHTPREAPRWSPWALGIDTACVFGGALTACILPGRSLVQVRARKAYYA